MKQNAGKEKDMGDIEHLKIILGDSNNDQ